MQNFFAGYVLSIRLTPSILLKLVITIFKRNRCLHVVPKCSREFNKLVFSESTENLMVNSVQELNATFFQMNKQTALVCIAFITLARGLQCFLKVKVTLS